MFTRNCNRCFCLFGQTAQFWLRHAFHSTKVLAAETGKVTDGFVKDLKGIVGKSNVSTAEAIREQHGHDESYHPTKLPDVVVFANNVDHVSHVAKMCNKNNIPLIAFGSGTGLEGGVNAVKGGVCVDLSPMKEVVELNAEDFDCTVEAGVTRMELNSYIRDTGLTFSIDPGADATLCGMCATSASGTNAVRYGTMRENTLNLEVVSADGNVFWTAGKGKRCIKTSAGYNLTNLFVGSEGTLGIITKAIIRLHAIPEATLSAVVHFPGIQEAVDTTVQVLQTGVPIARIEFLDEVAIKAFNSYSKYDMKEAPSLFLEFHGSSNSVKEQVTTVEEIAGSNSGSDFKWATDAEERGRLWKARHDLLYACIALVPGSKAYSTDVCVPVSNLPEMIIKTKEMIKEANIIGPIVGHVGDGNFHVFLNMESDRAEQIKEIRELTNRMTPLLGHVGDGNFHCVLLGKPDTGHFVAQAKHYSTLLGDLAMKLQGTCTGEHGVGIGKRNLLVKEVGPECVAAMESVKRAFDPNNILNPGKVFL